MSDRRKKAPDPVLSLATHTHYGSGQSLLAASFTTMRDELRTPLKTIIGYAEILIEDASHFGEVSVLPDLRRIVEVGQTLLTRVDAMAEPSVVDSHSNQFDLESFARSIRHDVRAPLNVILGVTELLLEDVGRREIKALIPDLQKIRVAAQNLLLLINSMINLSHLADDEPAISDPGGATPFFEVLDSEPRKVPVTILIAASNVLIRSLLVRFLTRQGDRAITADRGPRVIELLDQHPVDLLLLDLNLPEMNGFEVLQAIRHRESLQMLPVIVIAALTDIDLIAQSLQLGAEDYLPLPLNRVLLQARINAILERKRLRDRVVKHMQELAETVNQLKHSQAQAMEANRAKSTFLANMSHELRTPLNAVIGFSQMMARDLTLTSHHRETAGIIMRSGEHLLNLINDVLSISKIEAGKLTLKNATFDLPALVQGLSEMFYFRAQSKGITLDVRMDPGLPHYVSGDEGKLRQVLINLIGNAFKFTEFGRVVIRVKPLDEELCHFEVEDTGCGIAENDLEQLFEPFVQLNGPGRKNQEGTGLGLTISRNYVRLMGGDLTVRSIPTQGTSFSFWLPLPSLPSGEYTVPVSHSVIGLEDGQPHYRILVVEDQDDNRALLCRLLKSAGFEVYEAIDGKRAIEGWARYRPHLIMMDLHMAVLDGYEAMRIIRAIESGAGQDILPTSVDVTLPEEIVRTKIIAVSADAFGVDRSRIREFGGDDFIPKPFHVEVIFEKLREHLSVRFVQINRTTGQLIAPAGLVNQTFTPDRFQPFLKEWLVRMHHSIQSGDVDEAARLIEDIAPIDAELASELKKLLRSYDFDELIDALVVAIEQHGQNFQ